MESSAEVIRVVLVDDHPIYLDGLVTALEESENRGAGDVRIIVPPLVYRW